MASLKEKISVQNFSIENIDITELNELISWLPKNQVVDINIAEQGMILTLHAQDFCQEQIVKIDRFISIKEGEKNKAWAEAALKKAPAAGHKTAKDKEWFAQADDDFINAQNELTKAKACKRLFEEKADMFSRWHYAFKTFLRRDYSLETLGNFQGSFDAKTSHDPGDPQDLGGDIEWEE